MAVRTIMLAACALAGAALLASCETMSAEQCAAGDWGGLGFNDAAQNGRSRFSERAESCAEKGFGANADAYNIGFARGLYDFCQPPRAFDFARRGGSFNGACPAELQEPFYAAYGDGRRVYEAEQELSNVRSRIWSLESRRADIDDNIGSRERSLAEATTDEQRREHRNEIERLRRERRDVNDDIAVAQANVPRLMRYVDDLRFEMNRRWGVSW